MDCRYRTLPPSQVLISWDSTKFCLHNMRFPNIPNPVIVNLAEEGQDHGSKGHKSCKRFPWDKERLCEVKWSFMTKSTPATAARGGAGQGHATTLGLLVNSLINFYSEWFVRSLEEVFIMTAAAGIVLAQLYNTTNFGLCELQRLVDNGLKQSWCWVRVNNSNSGCFDN